MARRLGIEAFCTCLIAIAIASYLLPSATIAGKARTFTG